MTNLVAELLRVVANCNALAVATRNKWVFWAGLTYEKPCCRLAISASKKRPVVAAKFKVVAACCRVCCSPFFHATR
jgi:hypothetical protein